MTPTTNDINTANHNFHENGFAGKDNPDTNLKMARKIFSLRV